MWLVEQYGSMIEKPYTCSQWGLHHRIMITYMCDMCCQLFVEYFEADFVKNTSADIIDANTINRAWVCIVPYVSKVGYWRRI